MPMKILAAALLVLAPAVFAADAPEALKASALAGFSALCAPKLSRAPAASVPAKPAGKATAASMRTVHVSGSVNLNGSGNVMRGSTIVWVTFSGWGTISDPSGRVTSGSTSFQTTVACNVNGGWVNCSGWPSWSADFYQDGRWLGRGSVSGSLSSSSYAPNGFFTANAYTMLSGDVTVQE